jgi:3'-phosphoadenosine 5'-phosphosulfate sulfotransferase (PAPS reductase)/FAD synthetase
MRNPYLIQGPAVIQVSGGRTSGYLLKQILDAHGGKLPPNVYAAFENTGKEDPRTLDFVQQIIERWGVHITWLEYRYEAPAEPGGDGRHYYEVVSHNSASRNGEPFDQLIQARKFLPNPVNRFCSIEMKIRTCYRWVRAELGWDRWTNIVGLRADEPRRVAKARQRNATGKERFDVGMPLALAGVTKRDVAEFWSRQPFDLALPNVNGATPLGNCDLCFMKSWQTIFSIVRDKPELADWWIAKEREAAGITAKPNGALFRQDRPPYAKIHDHAMNQGDLLIGDDSGIDCACTD